MRSNFRTGARTTLPLCGKMQFLVVLMHQYLRITKRIMILPAFNIIILIFFVSMPFYYQGFIWVCKMTKTYGASCNSSKFEV